MIVFRNKTYSWTEGSLETRMYSPGMLGFVRQIGKRTASQSGAKAQIRRNFRKSDVKQVEKALKRKNLPTSWKDLRYKTIQALKNLKPANASRKAVRTLVDHPVEKGLISGAIPIAGTAIYGTGGAALAPMVGMTATKGALIGGGGSYGFPLLIKPYRKFKIGLGKTTYNWMQSPNAVKRVTGKVLNLPIRAGRWWNTKVMPNSYLTKTNPNARTAKELYRSGEEYVAGVQDRAIPAVRRTIGRVRGGFENVVERARGYIHSFRIPEPTFELAPGRLAGAGF
jgi:hypothetical protein